MGMLPRMIRADLPTANTQRTVDRQFLFKPCPAIANIIGASAARAQKKFPIKIYWLEFNINHEQCGIAPLSDSKEHRSNIIEFRKLFHRLLSGEINRHFNREGGVFSTPARAVPCIDEKSLEQQFFYALTNPVKDGLVDRISHWKGFSSYHHLAHGREQRFTYFDRTAWHRQNKRKPLQAYLKSTFIEFSPLPSMEGMKPSQRQKYIRQETRKLEQEFREQRRKNSATAMSESRMNKLDPRDRPKSNPARTPIPICHSSSPAATLDFRLELKLFLNAYRTASAAYRAGAYDTKFPMGSCRPPLIALAA